MKTATVQSASVALDKKVCFLAYELKSFRMGITCVSKTK